MKRIIEECSKGHDVNPFEAVKLRLRGKGSGFKEGPSQEESEDPLNLCISSKYKEKYEYACNEMETLLLKVYEEYKYFYMHKSRRPSNWDHKLTILKEETITQPKVFEESGQFQQSFHGFEFPNPNGFMPPNPVQPQQQFYQQQQPYAPSMMSLNNFSNAGGQSQ